MPRVVREELAMVDADLTCARVLCDEGQLHCLILAFVADRPIRPIMQIRDMAIDMLLSRQKK